MSDMMYLNEDELLERASKFIDRMETDLDFDMDIDNLENSFSRSNHKESQLTSASRRSTIEKDIQAIDKQKRIKKHESEKVRSRKMFSSIIASLKALNDEKKEDEVASADVKSDEIEKKTTETSSTPEENKKA